MQVAYLHVVINHLPIMGVPIALGVLVLGLWTRSEAIKHAALLTFVALGVATLTVYFAGRGGEDFVENYPGMSEAAIEAHEEMATIALVATETLAAVSLALLLRYGGLALLLRHTRSLETARPLPTAAALLVVGLAAGTAAILGYTGKLGGRISHTEFADGAAQVDKDDHRHRGRGGRDD